MFKLGTPQRGLAEVEQAGGNTGQTFNLIIGVTCCVTKTTQMGKTDRDFYIVAGIGWGHGKLLRKIP